MYDKLRDLASLMGNAGKFKERLQQAQDELATKTVQADSGAGADRRPNRTAARLAEGKRQRSEWWSGPQAEGSPRNETRLPADA